MTFEPELRPGPPWVMEEMIWSQPDLPEQIAGSSEAGAHVVLVTAMPEGVPAGIEPIPTPMHDRSWCHTIAYLSPLLLHALFAGLSPQRARELIAAQLAARPRRHEQAGLLANCRRLLVVGSGVDEITAAELALKLEEATYVPTTPLGVEKVLHGHLPAADRDTGLVLLRFDPDHHDERDRRSADVAAAARVLDMPAIEVGAADAATRAEALLAGGVALQVLTLELCLQLGTNPDLIRREQPLYRKVAEAGGAG
jgi:glutamine---fructose-6-phosphate transaminase (isomerizing)